MNIYILIRKPSLKGNKVAIEYIIHYNFFILFSK
ncbi:Uncharacterised protein [Streptococcus pneumoniae]|nr:Uncharacterised protein [Streptococcus pneumoniae]CGF78992.1 Uncharacterised protein [Streptococcus pneumoniae]CJD39827.1 Uncharacterised protein [Streptococcus pneumoniae]CJE24680.1 Uncharacterised protein [Streptococcus pneumoniae]COC03286.1 Uncharacterised protein [Streptococcus pneumoniae]